MLKETKIIKKIIIGLFLMFSVLGAVPVSAQVEPLAPECSGREADYAKLLNTISQDERINSIVNREEREKARREEYNRRVQQFKENSCDLPELLTSAARLINFLIGSIGLLVVIRLVAAGFQLVIAGGDAGAIKKARSAITNSIIGIAIVFGSYVIVNTIFEVFDVRLGAEQQFSFPYNPFTQK